MNATSADIFKLAADPKLPAATRDAILRQLHSPSEVKPAATLVKQAVTKGMNGTEKRYAAHLEMQRQAGGILWFAFDRLKLRMAGSTFYSPDFLVVWADGRITCDETKGFERDDAIVKFKATADAFPMFGFRMLKWIKGRWEITRSLNELATIEQIERAVG